MTPDSPSNPRLKRAFIFIEDGEYERADALLEEVLNRNPENAKAYVGKLMIVHGLRTEEDLAAASASLMDDRNFKRACLFADAEYRAVLLGYVEDSAYQHALNLKKQGKYEEAAAEFSRISSYKDAEQQAADCHESILRDVYTSALEKKNQGAYTEAAEIFRTIPQYQDADHQAEECRELALKVVYDSACEKMQREEYRAAEDAFSSISQYKDAEEMAAECRRLREEKSRISAEKRREEQQQKEAEQLKQEAERKANKKPLWKKIVKGAVIGVSAVFIFFLLCIILFAVIVFTMGGTEDVPIILSTPEDLMSISSFTTSGGTGQYTNYVLGNDIDLSGYSWKPLGDSAHQFYGTIDGNGYTIRNMHIDAGVLPDSKDSELGFIHTLHKDSLLCNLNFENVKISGTSGTETVGVIAHTSYGRIQKCKVSEISTTPLDGFGGIIYRFLDTESTKNVVDQIYDCTVSGTISGKIRDVGGIVCHLTGSGDVSYCTFTGDILLDPESRSLKNTVGVVGGIAGSVTYGWVHSCRVTGTIHGNGYVGGICGLYDNADFSLGALIEKSSYDGNLIAEASGTSSGKRSYAYAGGLVGNFAGTGTLRNCVSYGTVSSNTLKNSAAEGYAGGIAGVAEPIRDLANHMTSYGTIEECTSLSTVYVSKYAVSQGLFGKTDSGYYDETNKFKGEVKRK